MKKIIALFIFVLVSGFLYAGEYIHSLWSAGTSAIFYGDPAINKVNDALEKDDYTNIVLTGEYGCRFQLDDKIDFVMLGFLTFDSYGGDTGSMLRLDYGISGGVRLRPGLGGVSLGCEYCTGQRADMDSLDGKSVDTTTTQWGNGYRFLFEYDFSSLLTGIAPVIGISWKSMPRGHNYRDGNLAFYFRLVGMN